MKKSLPEGTAEKPERPNQGPPVSLEAERRKAMMLIHSAEKEVLNFREKHFRRPKSHFSIDTVDFLHYVVEKAETRRVPKTWIDFK
nr:hypothetical protein BaRGS_003008 [Batillaria attramentaria]